MARDRTYKNGVFGHRYKGYYIIRGESKGKFAIWNEDKSIYKDNIFDYDECEWVIDKSTVDPEEMELIKELYKKEIYELSGLFVELMQKRERDGTLDAENQKLYRWVEKIRKRKAEDRDF